MKLLHHTPDWNSTPHEAWRDWQLKQLRDYLHHRVIPFSANYKRMFGEHGIHPLDIKSYEDWSHVKEGSRQPA